MRRRPNPVVTEEYFAKRSTSVADSHSLSKLNIKKKEQQKSDIDNQLNEMMMKFKLKDYSAAI